MFGLVFEELKPAVNSQQTEIYGSGSETEIESDVTEVCGSEEGEQIETESEEVSTPKESIPVKEQQPASMLTKYKTNVDAEMASQETLIKKAKKQVRFVTDQFKAINIEEPVADPYQAETFYNAAKNALETYTRSSIYILVTIRLLLVCQPL